MNEKLEVTAALESPRFLVLHLAGTLDARGAMRLEEHALAARTSRRHLVVNLARVTFISSTGIGVLLALSEEFGDLGLSVRLSAPSGAVMAPIQLLSLDRFFPTYASDGEAIADWAA